MKERFSAEPRLCTLNEVADRLKDDPNIGYYCQDEDTLLAFGDGGLGDTSLIVAHARDDEVEINRIILYHAQEASFAGWLLATIAQGMTQDERATLYADLMARIADAEAHVVPIDMHHTTFGTPYHGEEAAHRLRAALARATAYSPVNAWLDAHSMSNTLPAIRTAAYPDVQQIAISDEYEETRFTITYQQAASMAVGLTVYNRGRLRPENMKHLYEGLLA